MADARAPTSRTVPDLIDELARRLPEHEALVGGGRRYTYRQLRAETRRIARALHALGVRRGDKVAILMGNRPEWVIADRDHHARRRHDRGQHVEIGRTSWRGRSAR